MRLTVADPDFSRRRMPTPEMGYQPIIASILAFFLVENCMKMKKNWTGRGRPQRPHLDPPLVNYAVDLVIRRYD